MTRPNCVILSDMIAGTPISTAYCGRPPSPGALIERFNLDPVLIFALLLVAMLHLWRAAPEDKSWAAGGWAVAAVALISPLCALSVSLFAARAAQHLILILIAAPMIAAALPPRRATPRGLALASAAFLIALWLWHMPTPYDATFGSTALYWAMHLTLFGSATALWRLLLDRRGGNALPVLIAGAFAAIQMGLLGAVLTLAPYPLFRAHLATTAAWGLAPLTDQQLGGLIMWVPGGLLFLWLALRSVAVLLHPVHGTSSAGRV